MIPIGSIFNIPDNQEHFIQSIIIYQNSNRLIINTIMSRIHYIKLLLVLEKINNCVNLDIRMSYKYNISYVTDNPLSNT